MGRIFGHKRVFHDKTVVITGAASGLGAALCHAFGARGARIGALDVDAAGLHEQASKLTAGGIQAATAVADLTDPEATRTAMADLRRDLGPVDVLVNNAGITHRKAFGSGEGDAVRRVMAVNFQGAVHATEAVYDELVSRRGLIIAISSVAGFAPLVRRCGYAASKHAMQGFFSTLRAELHGTGTDVLIVCPSFIATNIRDVDTSAEMPKDDSVGRIATPETIAEKIVRAAERRRPLLITGAVGHLSHWLVRLAPSVYTWLMRRRMG